MPLINYNYISNWHNINYLGPRLIKTFSADEILDSSKENVLAGDIGHRVVNIGNKYWRAQLDSPLILPVLLGSNGFTSTTGITGLLDIILDSYETLRNPTLQALADFFMESGSITVNEQGVNCNATLISDRPFSNNIDVNNNIFQINTGVPFDYLGRVVRHYDTNVSFITNNQTIEGLYQIISCNLKISSTIQKTNFPGSTQIPFFSVQGYDVSGDITLLVKPQDYYNFNINLQNFGTFETGGLSTLIINIANKYSIYLSDFSLIKNIKCSLSSGQFSTVSFSFESFARYS